MEFNNKIVKKVSCLFLIVFSVALNGRAQNGKGYVYSLIDAHHAFEDGEFLKAARIYQHIFETYEDRSTNNNYYSAASAWVLADNFDSAFICLDYIAGKHFDAFDSYGMLVNEFSLLPLHGESQWDSLVKKVIENYKYAHDNLDKGLIGHLTTIYHDDQGDRKVMGAYIEGYGEDSPQMDEIVRNMASNDSVNQIKIRAFLKEHGWLGENIIGFYGSQAIYLTLMHADTSMRIEFLPVVRQAQADGNLRLRHLANYEDVLALDRGLLQIYGTELIKSIDTIYVAPLMDPEHVNERRMKIGLNSMEKYLGSYELKWDVERYNLGLVDTSGMIQN